MLVLALDTATPAVTAGVVEVTPNPGIAVAGAPDAAPTALPQMARLVARPVLQGVVGSPVWSREVPVMVVKPNAAEQSGK